MLQQPERDWSLRLQQDLFRRLLPDWLLHPALQVVRQLEVVPPLGVGLVAAVAVPAANLWQAPAALRVPDSSAPEQPDSYRRLPAALVPEAVPVRAKPARTRVNRDR